MASIRNCHFVTRKLFILCLLLCIAGVLILNVNYQKENFTLLAPNFHSSRARFDNYRVIKIYEWIHTAGNWDILTVNFNVCLATQASVDRIWSIVEVAEKWQGPISLSVYVATSAEYQILNAFISYMKKCSDIFRDTVSVHMAVPIQLTVIESENERSVMERVLKDLSTDSCKDPKAVMDILIRSLLPEGRDSKIVYPQNHMRNIARKTCGTDWVLMTDVDIIPKQNSAAALHEFHNSSQASKCVKCVFVIPTLELESSLAYPETKKQMVEYANSGHARPFHFKIYHHGHNATNYEKWYKSNLEEGPVMISHTVDPKKMEYYEPFYISSDNIPPHDERFRGYGFTRNSQVLEAKMAGWNFTVLSPIFSVHWGLQTTKTLFTPTLSSGKNLREDQKQHNWQLYKDLVVELNAKYKISNHTKP